MEFAVRPYQKGEEKYAADIHQRLYTEEYSLDRQSARRSNSSL